ncbi:MAG: PilZ domain-containing protein [Treponema sp.]|jgi:c-di-GMP-binding flagellar brake protein YcgR|nr:PilZ domain-containing protein [Treponema sp.]
MFFLGLFILMLTGFLIVYFFQANKEKKGSWLQFFAKGKDAGFSLQEIDLLRRLAVKANLEEPSSLFWSQHQLDICIRSLVRSIEESGGEKTEEDQNFLSKLYDYRKKIEMEKPRIKKGISSTQQIGESQQLRILVPGTGVFRSRVIKNIFSYITIARPQSNKAPAGLSWTGLPISVYFWRNDDAGYVFDSEVLDEVFSRGLSALKIAHSESLIRTQKRKSIRIKTHKPAFLYLISNDGEPGGIEFVPGLKCFLEDLSESGCAVTIGGKATEGLRVKVQFALDDSPISMSGTVRSIEYKQDSNRSLLHIEADELSLESRNRILGEVFGMLPENEDDESLPFRVMEEDEKTEADQSGPDNNAL